ncbi:major capsid protein [Peptostreptococcus equinus]|uniref:Major capsid protein n=1 Tax=Peptostreptococcus equinus TaxID=3003601 RepID=A0ABY7JSL7_9FIRM|nr:major capsid protein [Peptostreptococcus sp. CBA3647]WAW15449.1 major capsid protein [Peptostreptococcus sp. CBA3647]
MKFDEKSFNGEAWAKYMQAFPNARLNKLVSSGAIVSADKRLQSVFKDNTQTGTVYAKIPYFGRIGGQALNYDGVTDLKGNRTKTLEQGVFTLGRMNSWIEADFSYDITGGEDFDANIRSQIQDYWNDVDQDVILSVLKGIFSMSDSNYKGANKNFVAKHTLDISSSGAPVATDENMLVGATTLNKAIQQAGGDNKNSFTLVFMHSAVATNLENLRLLEHLKYTDENGVTRDLTLATWNGRLVVIDDNMPVESKKIGAESAAVDVYTSYVLGNGAISLTDVGAKVPFEMFRDPHTKGGETELISRVRKAIAVAGISYLKKSQATNSPTNAELENGSNWELINDGTEAINDKFVPLARIISRG